MSLTKFSITGLNICLSNYDHGSHIINTCSAKNINLRFQANFRLNHITLNVITYLVVVIQIIQFGSCLYFKNNTIFHSFEAGNTVSIVVACYFPLCPYTSLCTYSTFH